jgi:sulfate adenylyltransferase
VAVVETLETNQFGSTPHSGELVNLYMHGSEGARLAAESEQQTSIELSARELSDVEMLAMGGYSPLSGFMGQKDFESVVDRMRLANGLPWTIPITLSLPYELEDHVRSGDRIALSWQGRPLAVLTVDDLFRRDVRQEAAQVYRTTDTAHPGVAALYAQNEMVVGGPIRVFDQLPELPFAEYRLSPLETRRKIAERKWRTVVGFQTRNPVHRAHEYLQKCALETVDGLLLHPLVGETKSDDVPADVRMRSYEALLANYYPQDRVLLAVNPAAMRYGGPREAIFHAIIRKNFGCTHFIVGRDHAGVGNYYGPYDAQHIFANFSQEELGIQPLFFENSFYCNACGNMATEKTCPHGPEDRVTLSGTQVRAMLRAGELPPPQFSRPEVARILAEGMRETA